MVKTRVIRLQGVEDRNVRDQIALGTFLSLRMLATYIRRMRNYNLEISDGDFGDLFILNLSKMLKFAVTHLQQNDNENEVSSFF